MDEVKGFQKELEELTLWAKENGKHVSIQQIRSRLKDSHLGENQIQMVADYLDAGGIEVYDEDLQEAAPEEKGHIRSLEKYLQELDEIGQFAEGEEIALFDRAAEGEAEAKALLTEKYLQTVCDLAGEIESREKERGKLDLTKGFTEEDLVQEGNIGLLLAVEHIRKEESLAAYRVKLLNEVTDYLEKAVQAQMGLERSDEKVLTRMNRLADAVRDLEAELERRPSLEEVSAYLDIPAEEIQDMLRVGGQNLNIDQL